jgi:hypothetical protein
MFELPLILILKNIERFWFYTLSRQAMIQLEI